MMRAPLRGALPALAALLAAVSASAETVHPKSRLFKALRPEAGRCEIRFRMTPAEGFDPAGLKLYAGVKGKEDFLVLGGDGKDLVLRRVREGRAETIARAPAGPFAPGAERSIHLRLTGSGIAVHDGARRLIDVEDAGAGATEGSCGIGPCPRVRFKAPVVQPVAGIYFTDGFMRDRALGSWRRHGGKWATSFVANEATSVHTFSLGFSGDRPGTVSSGEWFWSDYSASVSVRAERRGSSAGLGFYWRGSGDHFLLRCTGAGRPGGRVELARVSGGVEEVLGGFDGSILPGQWYRLKVLVRRASARAYIDDTLVAQADDAALTGGRVALLASGTASFDDVAVRGISVPAGEMSKGAGPALEAALASAEAEAASVTDIFSQRPTMREWATSSGRWRRDGAFNWCPTVFHGPVRFTWKPRRPLSGGVFSLAVAGEPRSTEGALSAVVSVDGQYGTAVATITRAGKTLARKALPPGPLGEVTADIGGGRLSISGARGPAAEAPLAGTGHALGYRGFGSRAGSMVKALSPNVFDYNFARAPSDWYSPQGTWRLHSRWTCDPRWSWFGGWNESGPAWLWHKRRLGGDVSAEAHCAFMMLGAGWPQGYRHPFNARIAISASGPRADSGYLFVYANVDGPSMILRRGKVVAKTDRYVEKLYPGHNSVRAERIHRRWLHLQAVRSGAALKFYVDRELLLEYTDPKPLEGDMVGFGSERNGINIARAILSAERPGAKRLFLVGGGR